MLKSLYVSRGIVVLFSSFTFDASASHVLTFCFLTMKGTHEDILNFVETKFGAKDKFTWFEKGQVNGAKTREVYSFLKEKLPSDDGTKDIR